jgi:hypothetical protein
MTKFIFFLLMPVILAVGSLYGQSETRLKVSTTTTHGDRVNGYIVVKSLPPYLTVYYNSLDSILLNTQLLRTASFRRYDKSDVTVDVENGDSKKFRIQYFNNTMVGILSGKSNDDTQPVASLTVETINGVRILQYLSVGLGIAYDQYNSTATLPFFVSFRGDILDHIFTPFYFVDLGYGSAWDTNQENNGWEFIDVEGGMMFHSGIGFKMYSGDRVNVMIALGFKMQETVYRQDWGGGGERVTDRSYKRLSFRIGIGF